MKGYITNTQNLVQDTTNFPGNILKDFGTTNKTKFILFNNIRLDFNRSSLEGVKPDRVQQNKNIREAYTLSINFAKFINPLTKGFSFGKRYTSFGKRNKKISLRSVKKVLLFLKKIKGTF
jgi:hypothetical protein